MPTQKPRFSIAIDDDLLKAVDDYKFSNRIKSQNQAINDLVRAGLGELSRMETEAIRKASETEITASETKENPHIQIFPQDKIMERRESTASPEEMERLIKKYRTLDKYGQSTVLAVLDCEYTRCTESVAIQNSTRRIVPLPSVLKAILPDVDGLDYDDDPKTNIQSFAGRDGTLTEWALSDKQAAQLNALLEQANLKDASDSL